MLLVGWQEGHPACKKYAEDGGGGHWLDRMEWRPARWSVCLPLVIFPCTIKYRSSLLAPGHMGGPGKRAVKRLWWWSWQKVNVPYNRHPYPPKLSLPMERSGLPSNTWFPWPTRVLNPNGISISSAVLQGSLVWQTEGPRYSIGRIYRLRRKKSNPLDLLVVFSATAWNFNMKFYTLV